MEITTRTDAERMLASLNERLDSAETPAHANELFREMATFGAALVDAALGWIDLAPEVAWVDQEGNAYRFGEILGTEEHDMGTEARVVLVPTGENLDAE